MFEQGVIRPPSEAESLLVRVTRNCPWNRCHICPAYKGETFSKRSVEDVKKDIDAMAEDYSTFGERIQSAFLQDADTLIIPTDELVEIIEHLKKRFPGIERITTYARAKSMKNKSIEALKRLKEAGLTRIHNGMESGSLKVLKLIRKGIRPEDTLEGGKKVMASGISLSEYIMPGVGGRELSREHAIETARILNQIRPDFIRVRSFAMHPQSPMQKMVEEGSFTLMSDMEVVEEIRLLLEHLDEMPSHFRCGDFSLNLLMQVDGPLDTHKKAMLREIDRYLALPMEKKQAYSLIQRSYPGMRSLDMLDDEDLMEKVRANIEELRITEEEGFNRYIDRLKVRQLPQLQKGVWVS